MLLTRPPLFLADGVPEEGSSFLLANPDGSSASPVLWFGHRLVTALWPMRAEAMSTGGSREGRSVGQLHTQEGTPELTFLLLLLDVVE